MQDEEIKALFANSFDNQEGKDVLYYIYKLCDDNKLSVYQSPDGKIDVYATLYNEGRRSIWTYLRKHLPLEILEYVEVRAAYNESKRREARTKEF